MNRIDWMIRSKLDLWLLEKLNCVSIVTNLRSFKKRSVLPDVLRFPSRYIIDQFTHSKLVGALSIGRRKFPHPCMLELFSYLVTWDVDFISCRIMWDSWQKRLMWFCMRKKIKINHLTDIWNVLSSIFWPKLLSNLILVWILSLINYRLTCLTGSNPQLGNLWPLVNCALNLNKECTVQWFSQRIRQLWS